MLFDIKKLFTKGSTIGRFEYLKLVLGLVLFPVFFFNLTIITPPNNVLYYPFLIITILISVSYTIICYIATFKRLNNILNNTPITIVCFILFVLSSFIKIVDAVFKLLLILIPGKKNTDKIISNKLFYITFFLVIILFISGKLLGFSRYQTSESMADTIQVNDKVIVNIFDKEFSRGDLIAHELGNSVYIKRVIALPGEKVEIKTFENGTKHVFINDKILVEPYVKSAYDYPDCSAQMKCEPTIVPENNYYLLGDNRGKSFDSRYLGTFHKNTVKGKVSHIWFPVFRQQVFTTPNYTDGNSLIK